MVPTMRPALLLIYAGAHHLPFPFSEREKSYMSLHKNRLLPSGNSYPPSREYEMQTLKRTQELLAVILGLNVNLFPISIYPTPEI